MEYHLKLDDKHSLTVSAQGSPDQSFRITDTQIDLSRTNLFADPTRNADGTSLHPLLPLADEVRSAFALLDQAPDHSLLVKALREFRDNRLPLLLTEIENPQPRTPVDTAQLRDPKNATKAETTLKAIVARIEKELPHYFASEKDIGTFDWLESGARDTKLPVAIADRKPFSPDDVKKSDTLLVERSGRFVEFDARTGTAHVLSGGPPSAATVINALCNSGTLGNELYDLNRGALLKTVCKPLIEHAEATEVVIKTIDDIANKPVRHKLTTVLGAITPALIVSTFLGPSLMIHAINNTVTPWDLVNTFLLTANIYFGLKAAAVSLRVRESQITMKQEHEKMMEVFGEIPMPPPRVELTNIFATALIDHTVHRSAGNSRILLAPKGAADWLTDLPEVAAPDMSIIPTKKINLMGMRMRVPAETDEPSRVEVETRDDYSGHELALDELQQISFRRLVTIDHIERASETWNLFHAVALLREFSERQNLTVPGAKWFDIKSELNSALGATTDQSDTYPRASECFSGLTEKFQLNRSSWEQTSRALAAASVLERVHETRRAQEIAQEIFKAHFPAH